MWAATARTALPGSVVNRPVRALEISGGYRMSGSGKSEGVSSGKSEVWSVISAKIGAQLFE